MIDYRIHKTARLARGVIPGAFTVIEAGVVAEEGVTIASHCYIGPNVTIHKGATIGPHCTILTDVPPNVTIAPGTVLGSVVQSRQMAPVKRGKVRSV